ncbi:MAG: CBS domain-containing protein [Planctomycetes bacterium]|nr:CBS domain-containing protein [Planctomycetota bacterium]
MVNTLVSELVKRKGVERWSIAPDETVIQALREMASRDCGALVVAEENDRVVGIFSERDYARKIVLLGRHSDETLVGEIMTTPVICAEEHWTVEESLRTMMEHRIRHLPVVKDNILLGVLSLRDVAAAVVEPVAADSSI